MPTFPSGSILRDYKRHDQNCFCSEEQNVGGEDAYHHYPAVVSTQTFDPPRRVNPEGEPVSVALVLLVLLVERFPNILNLTILWIWYFFASRSYNNVDESVATKRPIINHAYRKYKSNLESSSTLTHIFDLSQFIEQKYLNNLEDSKNSRALRFQIIFT